MLITNQLRYKKAYRMGVAQNFPIGISNFAKVIQKKCVFIDKTMFIKEIVEDIADVILITRPRRFGKTLNMSMLEAFLSVDGEDVFYGLNISNERDFCIQHKNKYPVIFLTFKEIGQLSLEDASSEIRILLQDLYTKHYYVLEGDALLEHEKDEFKKILCGSVYALHDLSHALSRLVYYVHKFYGVKPILLIDEYDSPVHNTYDKDHYDAVIDFLRVFLGNTLKDNSNLEKAVMTGITKVAQESFFSGLNNIKAYTILDEKYAQFFGFTEKEVISILPAVLSIEPIRNWYNGYKIGDYEIYNPWSIIECLNNKGKLFPYWINTTQNSLLYSLIENANDDIKGRFESLIEGEIQDQIISSSLTLKYLRGDEDSIWTLLLHAGYLNVISSFVNEDGKVYAKIAIPNKEVMSIYTQMIEKRFIISKRSAKFYETFIGALESGNVDEFARHIREYILESGSYFDFTKHTPERVFHVFMLGLLVGLRSKYIITSNKESGLGRVDMMLIPKDISKQGIILEFKACKQEKDLENLANEALIQIQDRKYATSSFSGPFLCIGMAFCGKEMMEKHVVLDRL